MEAATAGGVGLDRRLAISAIDLPEAIRNRWPDAKLRARIIASDDPAPAKQVTLTLIADGGAADAAGDAHDVDLPGAETRRCCTRTAT